MRPGRVNNSPSIQRNRGFTIVELMIASTLGLMVLAYLVNSGLHALLQRAGAYRHVWHPALFNLALYGIVLGLLFHLLRWMQS